MNFQLQDQFLQVGMVNPTVMINNLVDLVVNLFYSEWTYHLIYLLLQFFILFYFIMKVMLLWTTDQLLAEINSKFCL